MSENNVIPAKEFMKLLCPALGIEYKRLRRIVLDMSYDSIITAYVELIGDSRLLELSQSLEGVEIKVVNVQEMAS